MKQPTRNFEDNIKARAKDLYDSNRIDCETLYSMTYSRFKRVDNKFKFLSEEQKNMLINNVLIFAFTDYIISHARGNEELNVSDEILKEIIILDKYRQDNMYPSLMEQVNDEEAYRK